MLALSAPEAAGRIAAAQQLRGVRGASSERLRARRLAVEGDPAVLAALKEASQSVEASLKRAEMVGLLFSGLSLGSVLLLAALGLAVTFGLMGVINMAHGELLMIGAYATWLVQLAFRRWAPGHVDGYLAAAVPASFLAAALIVPPLALTVVPTPRVDLIAFALGSGIAGLGGCALSQIGNVGPELGQGFIVDSFMVVVLGGVGQLAGTVAAAASLGLANKVLEPFAGAVLAKIVVLAFIILFIQRRPQGLFALRGRAAEE